MRAPAAGDALFPEGEGQKGSRILVMGIGGAGCNIARRMGEAWSDGPEIVAVNADVQALGACGIRRTIAIGEKTTRGQGTAGDVAAGRLAAEESLGQIQDALTNADVLFLVAGLGGGTGTGAAPVIAKAARQLGILTLGLVSLPFPFEGATRQRVAEEGLRSLQRALDAVICLPNERLLKMADPDAGLEAALRQADEMLSEGVHAIWHLLAKTGVINLTLADIRELAERSGGSLSYGYADASGPARAATALRELMESPLLDQGRLLSEAQGLLVNITGGPDLKLSDLQGIMGQIASLARPSAHISMGAVIEPSRRDRITITLLASHDWNEDVVEAAPDPAAAERGAAEGQAELPLSDGQADRGAFGKSPATLVNGQDLDIPTFIRRGIKLSFDR